MDKAARDGGGGLSFLGATAANALGGVLASAASAATGAMTGFIGSAITQAGDFEASVNNLAAVSGTALADAGFSFDDVSAKALQLGQDTRYSASESIAAMTELVKGGVPVVDVMGEATDATLNLAAAAGVELGPAAEIVSKQFGVWSDTGVGATEVTDLLTQAANASTVGVEDLALGLANAGGTAKVAGLSYEELVTSMALIAPNFASASDAGTSFKTFLSRLIPTTNPAKEAMAELGLYTAETGSAFYDASGNFIGMKEAAELLQGATSHLSEEQRLLAFNTIFGSDAIRAAAAVADAGAEGYADIGQAMADAGTAAEVAAIQNQGWVYVMDSLNGAMDTLKITIGTALLPILTPLVEKLADGVGVLSNIIGALTGSRRAFDELSGPIQGVLAPLLGMSAALASTSETIRSGAQPLLTFQNIFAALPAPLQSVVRAAQAIGTIVSTILLPPLAALGGLIAGQLTGAFATWMPIIANGLEYFAMLAQIIAETNIPIGILIGVLLGGNPIFAAAMAIFQNWGAISATMGPAIAGILPVIQPFIDFIAANWQPILAGAAGIVTALLVPAIAAAIGIFAGAVIAAAPVIAILAAVGAGAAMLYNLWTSNFMGIQQITASALAAVQALITSVMGVVLAFWQQNGAEIMAFAQVAWQGVQNIVGTVVAILMEVVTRVFTFIAGFISAHGDEILAVLTTAWNNIQTIVDTTIKAVQGILNTVLALIKGDWEGALTEIKNVATTVWEGIKTVIGNNIDLVKGLIQKLMDKLGVDLKGTLDKVGSFFDPFKGALDGIGSAIQTVIDFVSDLIAKFNALKDAIPDELVPGSPTPFEIGMRGIAGAIRTQTIPAVQGLGGAMRGAVERGETVNQRTYSLQRIVNVSQNFNSVPRGYRQDAAIVRALAGV